mmetsp:Transcript_97304/g.256869  ORF Transcript_97304/g.256869 Transcript_97304/m.256869 type:complete len:126 (-) Transcript_97304:3-380(-)
MYSPVPSGTTPYVHPPTPPPPQLAHPPPQPRPQTQEAGPHPASAPPPPANPPPGKPRVLIIAPLAMGPHGLRALIIMGPPLAMGPPITGMAGGASAGCGARGGPAWQPVGDLWAGAPRGPWAKTT